MDLCRVDALYFPYLSLPPATWVNPALLFFDQLALIAPDGWDRAMHDPRTRRLIDLDMVRAEVPRGGWNEEEDRIFLAYLLGRGTAVRRISGPIARVHAGKLAYGPLAEQLVSAGMMARSDGGWLEGAGWVAAHLMSYLALQVSANSERPLPLITDERAAAGVMVGGFEPTMESRRLKAATRLLPVPPDAQPEEIAEFRDRNQAELRTFREYVNGLISCDPATSTGEERCDERLRLAAEVRAQLVGEMDSFNWSERGVAIALVALPTAAAPLDHAPWTLGAGLIGLGLTGLQTVAARNRRVRGEDRRMIYSARVSRRWPPTSTSTLW